MHIEFIYNLRRNVNMASNVFLTLMITLISASPVLAGTVDTAQRMLNQLGYNSGQIDGAYGKKTRSALKQFYVDKGGSYDGNLDANELIDLQKAMMERGIQVTKPVAGIEIENIDSTLVPNQRPSIINDWYWWFQPAVVQDFDGDGLEDILYVGTQTPDDQNNEKTQKSPDDACGGRVGKGYCDTPLAPVSLFLGFNSPQYNYLLRNDLVVDNRKKPGTQNSGQVLIADYNGDGTLDIYVGDQGFYSQTGFRDSYFLSQANGTWLESSQSHIDKSNRAVFNHGAATGDIDADGDMDIVYTNLETRSIDCLINDGTGNLKTKSCGKIEARAIELADIDGDGDLDLIHAAHEDDNGKWNSRSGVAFNDGAGKFKYGSIKLPTNKVYYMIPGVSAWDLDADGDMDIIMSRAGKWYGGAALQVLENKGNGKFKETLYEYYKLPKGVRAESEFNEHNLHTKAIRFADVDRDGDRDIIMFYGKSKHLPQGSYLRNDGDMSFRFVPAGLPEVRQSEYTASTLVNANPIQKFTSFIDGEKIPYFDESKFENYSKPINLEKSGATIVGVETVGVLGNVFGYANILVEWGGIKFPTSITVKTTKGGHTHYQVSMMKGKFLIDLEAYGFGQVQKFEKLGKGCGHGVGSCFRDKGALERENIDVGLLEFVKDLNEGAGKAAFIYAPVISGDDLKKIVHLIK